MSASATQGGHKKNKRQDENIYLACPVTYGGHKKSLSGHHRTTLSGYIFATEARVDNRKKSVKQQYLPQLFPEYGELRPTSG